MADPAGTPGVYLLSREVFRSAVLFSATLVSAVWGFCCAGGLQGDLLQLLSQEAGLKQQVTAMQERQVAAERARAADKAFLQVSAAGVHQAQISHRHICIYGS